MDFRGDLEALVLASLSDGPKHGYAMVRWIRAGAEGAFSTGEAQLYPILHRLEEDGFLSAEWVPQEGKPARKVYHLTDKGTVELDKRAARWQVFRGAMDRLIPGPEGACDGTGLSGAARRICLVVAGPVRRRCAVAGAAGGGPSPFGGGGGRV